MITEKWTDFDEFFTAYLEAALWSSNDESNPLGGFPLDDNYDIEDFTPEALAKMKADCEKFLKDNGHLLTDENCYNTSCPTMARAGHDFWLTRHHHGCGFWDGDWEEAVGETLTEKSQEYDEIDIIVGEDGKLHV